MPDGIIYGLVAVLLLLTELAYFKIAEHFNISDKPNARSSHSSVVLSGGGIVFSVAILVWTIVMLLQGKNLTEYVPFLCGLVLIAGVSFLDDIRSLPDNIRLIAHTTAMVLMFWSMGILHWNMWWIVLLALVVCVGATNIFNFMDGVNGMTAGYSLSVLVPLMLLNMKFGFIEGSYLIVSIIGVLVFCIFNFRPKGKARCFAGDVGSIGIAFIILFAIGRLIVKTDDLTYLILLLVYGIDGCLTILHRIMLHENLGEAHRKHAYQLMANELKIGHVKVSLLYMVLQTIVSLGFIYFCPDIVPAHWLYLIGAIVVLALAYIFFMKKYYHLHVEYLKSLAN